MEERNRSSGLYAAIAAIGAVAWLAASFRLGNPLVALLAPVWAVVGWRQWRAR